MIDTEMQAKERKYNAMTIIFALITTTILSVLILIITTRVSKRIIKTQKTTSNVRLKAT